MSFLTSVAAYPLAAEPQIAICWEPSCQHLQHSSNAIQYKSILIPVWFSFHLAIVKSEIELWLLVGPTNISFHKYKCSYVYFDIIQSIPSYGIEFFFFQQ